MSELIITWTRSCIGRPRNQREIIRSLGLHHLHDSVVHHDSPTILGMVKKVEHLLRVEEVKDAA